MIGSRVLLFGGFHQIGIIREGLDGIDLIVAGTRVRICTLPVESAAARN
jgi:hypothetical protein